MRDEKVELENKKIDISNEKYIYGKLRNKLVRLTSDYPNIESMKSKISVKKISKKNFQELKN